jgi:hypothetical protein
LPATRCFLRFLVVFFSTSFQYETSSNISEHSLPESRSDILKFLAIFFNISYQRRISSEC